MCVCGRERESERETERGRESESEREIEFVCVGERWVLEVGANPIGEGGKGSNLGQNLLLSQNYQLSPFHFLSVREHTALGLCVWGEEPP